MAVPKAALLEHTAVDDFMRIAKVSALSPCQGSRKNEFCASGAVGADMALMPCKNTAAANRGGDDDKQAPQGSLWWPLKSQPWSGRSQAARTEWRSSVI